MQPPSRLLTLASVLLLLMAVLNIVSFVLPQIPVWLSGVCGWLVLLLLVLANPALFGQFYALGGVGLVLLLIAASMGDAVSLEAILLQNNGLMVMLYCVGFLKLLSAPLKAGNQRLPVGRMSALKSLLGIHLLGAVINISILILVAERFKKSDAVNPQIVTLAGRGFSMAAFWSPFFGAMAVALTYAPGAALYSLMATGMVLALISIVYTLFELGGWRLEQLKTFKGYPLQPDSLWVPALLAGSVILCHQLWPALPVLLLVSCAALLLTLAFLFSQHRTAAGAMIGQHILDSAPRMARELGLFLGAGLLSVGAQLLFSHFSDFHPFDQVHGWLLGALLAGAIILSLLGIHPVVSVSIVGPFLASMQGDPTLIATLFLSMWSLGTVASPFSGTNAVMRNQFEVDGMDLMRWNIRYVMVMWVVVSLMFMWRA